MRVRYSGPEDAIELAIPGACLTFPRGEWLDPDEVAAAAFVPAHHLAIALASLGDGWEIEDTAKPEPRSSKKTVSDDQENPE